MRTRKSLLNATINLLTYLLITIFIFLTRKYLLEIVGEEKTGLLSFFQNIIGFLSLAELGIGTAIIYALYKPVQENNREKIVGYLQLYGKFYRIIGLLVFVIGLGMLPFLNEFVHLSTEKMNVELYFFIFLLNTVFTYFFGYKSSLLYATQNGYLLAIVDCIAKVVSSGLQLAILLYAPSFIAYLLAMVMGTILYLGFIHFLIQRYYPWISVTKGQIEKEEKEGLFSNIRSLFLHRFASFVVFSTDNLVIAYYLSLAMVAKFNNYYMIILFVGTCINKVYEGITASLGNLFLEQEKERQYEVFKRIFFLNFWIAATATILLAIMLNPFIHVWIGEKYIVESNVIVMLLLNFYFMAMRPTVERFKEAGGLYRQDRYAPLFEAGINLVLSVILVQKVGLVGVLIGTFISNVAVVFWVKPLVVYRYLFKRSVWLYFYEFGKYASICLLLIGNTWVLNLPFHGKDSWGWLMIQGIYSVGVIQIMLYLCFRRNKEFQFYQELIGALGRKERKVRVEN